MGKLSSDKYERFAQEYVVCSDKAKAAVRAGYSKRASNAKGSQLYAIVSIRARIDELQAAIAEKLDIKAEDIARQLDEYRRSNIADYVELVTEPTTIISKDGVTTTPELQVLKFKDFKDLTDEQKRCIESIKMGKQGIELKLHGTEWSVEKLNRHIGFYELDNNQGNKILLSTQDREDRISELLEKAKNA